ncbi:GPR1/FUN34/YaaH family transporter [Streptomyces sp. NPDC006368]|uniref:GPR1/FUN34/YaaH family transporter n=1 Tax=Streptomyces sp. NPDC006368 TaxID=3156760 RepID=UPI0033A4DAF6
MDNDVSAGSTATSTLGHLALGLTLLAGLLELHAGNSGNGTAFAGLGAFWFTWGTAVGGTASTEAAGLFLLVWSLLALTLTAAARGGGVLGQGVYGLLFLSLLLTGVGAFADTAALGRIGGWTAALAGLGAWYGATAAVAKWPVPSRRAAGRGVTATG